MNAAKETVKVNSTFHEAVRSERAERWLASRTPRYHEYRRKWVENPQNFIDEGRPLNIDIESSSACNLKCPMCLHTILMERGSPITSRHFDYELYKRIIDEAVQVGVCAVKLNWRGEPLMNPRIADMIRYAKEKGIEDVLMNTNAVLLSADMSRNIINAGIDNLIFSFDSPYKEKYESIRVGAVFEDVRDNIINFHRIRDEIGSVGPLTRAQMIRKKEDGDTEFQDYKTLYGGIVDTVAYIEYQDYERDYDLQSRRNDIVFSCFQPWVRMVIDVDGNIGVCCSDHGHTTGVGNINDMTVSEAWNSPAYKTVREKHKQYKWYEVKACTKCPSVLKAAE
jgi:radical SAM protein with 4Fe4S-binding SPASM domain